MSDEDNDPRSTHEPDDEEPMDLTGADPTSPDPSATDDVEPPGDGASEDPAVGDAAGVDDDVPLADLARRVADRDSEGRKGGTVEPEPGRAGTTDSPFEEMSVSEIDEETLWSSLGEAGDPTANVGIGEPAEPVSDSGPELREYVVAKEKYCQKCPHLSDPPDLTCGNEGTEIVEVVDSEHFRVRNCPIVEDKSGNEEG